eukprot:9543839-Ditylum_brightwellii.AAC.1
MNEGYIAAPLLSNNQTENKQPYQTFIDRFSQNSDTSSKNANSLLDWLKQGNSLNNYNTMFIQSLTFPTLVPCASGDATHRDCIFKVDFAESNHHLLIAT